MHIWGMLWIQLQATKKSQKFEDDYLELLFDVIKQLGFNAVTYMPSRNTIEQLKRLKSFR